MNLNSLQVTNSQRVLLMAAEMLGFMCGIGPNDSNTG